MINSKRVVPVSKTDLMTMYGTMMLIAAIDVSVMQAGDGGDSTPAGTGDVGTKIASEPVIQIDIGSDVTDAVIYFVPEYTYAGFAIGGSAVETGGVDVEADGVTLYKATLDSGAVTIAKAGF